MNTFIVCICTKNGLFRFWKSFEKALYKSRPGHKVEWECSYISRFVFISTYTVISNSFNRVPWRKQSNIYFPLRRFSQTIQTRSLRANSCRREPSTFSSCWKKNKTVQTCLKQGRRYAAINHWVTHPYCFHHMEFAFDLRKATYRPHSSSSLFLLRSKWRKGSLGWKRRTRSSRMSRATTSPPPACPTTRRRRARSRSAIRPPLRYHLSVCRV